jgi:hypothetical protein
MRLANLVVFPEKYRAAIWLERTNDSWPPLIIPNCPRLDFFPSPPSWEELIQLRWSTKEVLYIGGVSPENALLPAISALSTLSAQIKLRLVGGSRREFAALLLRAAGELDLRNRFSNEGWVPKSS